MARSVTESLRLLLARVVDYAGLFPPAQLDMARAAANYASYLEGEHSWMLGAFVVPAARLAELEPLIPAHQRPWTVSVLAGEGDAEQIARFVDSGAAVVPWAEVKGTGRAGLSPGVGVYHEIGGSEEIPAVRAAGGRAKFRTGAVTADGFPSPARLAECLDAALRADVAFKCTAGLHHAIRGEYALTYGADSARATMHGFLNVLGACVLEQRAAVLEERAADAFRFDDRGLRWRGESASNGRIRTMRETGMIAFGSCSFVEPVAELRSLGLL